MEKKRTKISDSWHFVANHRKDSNLWCAIRAPFTHRGRDSYLCQKPRNRTAVSVRRRFLLTPERCCNKHKSESKGIIKSVLFWCWLFLTSSLRQRLEELTTCRWRSDWKETSIPSWSAWWQTVTENNFRGVEKLAFDWHGTYGLLNMLSSFLIAE